MPRCLELADSSGSNPEAERRVGATPSRGTEALRDISFMPPPNFEGHKHCATCNQDKEKRKFNTRVVNGARYLQSQCRSCLRKKYSQTKRGRLTMAKADQRKEARFRNRLDRSAVIVRDSRHSDRRNGRSNDLDVVFTSFMIQKGCSYCGVSYKDCIMTLDRIDNSIGHIKSNVVPACWNCNAIRSDMPYAAWLTIAPAIRKAYEVGLFNGWVKHKRLKTVLERRKKLLGEGGSCGMDPEAPVYWGQPQRGPPRSGLQTQEGQVAQGFTVTSPRWAGRVSMKPRPKPRASMRTATVMARSIRFGLRGSEAVSVVIGNPPFGKYTADGPLVE